MSPLLEKSRSGCLLHGAVRTLTAIDGVVPIIHATAGCSRQQALGGGTTGGACGLALPATNVSEKQVVFGGTSRLREQIKNTVRLVKGDLYVVVSGCATELVGDDIAAMTREARAEGYPVIDIPTPGFRGDVQRGYCLAVKELCDELPRLKPPLAGKAARIINVLGVVPGQNVFWQGDLAEIKRLLEQLGLEVNVLFGPGATLDQWRRLPQAELNVAFSPAGVDIARILRDKYGTPIGGNGFLPVGPEDCAALLQEVADALKLESNSHAEFTAKEEQLWAHYLGRIAETYLESGFQKEFALVGEAGPGLGLIRFLAGTLGLIPKLWVITDNLAEGQRIGILRQVESMDAAVRPEVVFSEDGGQIHRLLVESRPELILGSSLEAGAAGELGVPLVRVAFPITDRVVLGKSYAGYRGAVSLLEDLGSAILAGRGKESR